MKAGRHAMAGRVPTRVPAVGREAAPVAIDAIAACLAGSVRFGFPLFVSANNGSASWTEAGQSGAIR